MDQGGEVRKVAGYRLKVEGLVGRSQRSLIGFQPCANGIGKSSVVLGGGEGECGLEFLGGFGGFSQAGEGEAKIIVGFGEIGFLLENLLVEDDGGSPFFVGGEI